MSPGIPPSLAMSPSCDPIHPVYASLLIPPVILFVPGIRISPPIRILFLFLYFFLLIAFKCTRACVHVTYELLPPPMTLLIPGVRLSTVTVILSMTVDRCEVSDTFTCNVINTCPTWLLIFNDLLAWTFSSYTQQLSRVHSQQDLCLGTILPELWELPTVSWIFCLFYWIVLFLQYSLHPFPLPRFGFHQATVPTRGLAGQTALWLRISLPSSSSSSSSISSQSKLTPAT